METSNLTLWLSDILKLGKSTSFCNVNRAHNLVRSLNDCALWFDNEGTYRDDCQKVAVTTILQLITYRTTPYFDPQVHEAGVNLTRPIMIISNEQSIVFYALDEFYNEEIGKIFQGVVNCNSSILDRWLNSTPCLPGFLPSCSRQHHLMRYSFPTAERNLLPAEHRQ
ncbi:hypothetical protein BJ165DRAFT_878321 [Panaeolus papilionaceus]|nr:hypothetical protein BJ165DRAFT_878321 [Panaeolus papilionaceus]